MRDVLRKDRSPVSDDADPLTIVRALYEIVKKHTDSKGSIRKRD